jgi:hypothetical protein
MTPGPSKVVGSELPLSDGVDDHFESEGALGMNARSFAGPTKKFRAQNKLDMTDSKTKTSSVDVVEKSMCLACTVVGLEQTNCDMLSRTCAVGSHRTAMSRRDADKECISTRLRCVRDSSD